MSQRPPRPQTADARLRPRLVLGWSLFFVFALVGAALAIRLGPSVPVLLDVMLP